MLDEETSNEFETVTASFRVFNGLMVLISQPILSLRQGAMHKTREDQMSYLGSTRKENYGHTCAVNSITIFSCITDNRKSNVFLNSDVRCTALWLYHQ